MMRPQVGAGERPHPASLETDDTRGGETTLTSKDAARAVAMSAGIAVALMATVAFSLSVGVAIAAPKSRDSASGALPLGSLAGKQVGQQGQRVASAGQTGQSQMMGRSVSVAVTTTTNASAPQKITSSGPIVVTIPTRTAPLVSAIRTVTVAASAPQHSSPPTAQQQNGASAPNTASARATAPVTAAASAPASTVAVANMQGEPCKSTQYFNGTPSQWQVPPSCYAGIYSVNPANYVARSGFGWCNWWVEVMNPSRPDLLTGAYPRGSTPRPGATVVFAGGVQGASSGGHYARVVAIAPGGQWFLVSEMNFTWRGGGWQKVNYRYVHVGPGISFIY